MKLDEKVSIFREYNNSLLPSWYSWKLHLLSNILIFSGFLYLGLKEVESLSLNNFAFFALSFLSWGAVEYFIHRFILHGSLFKSFNFKKEHTVFHHRYFTEVFLLAKRMNDLNRTLLRPIDIFSILLINLGLSCILGFFTTKEFGLFFYISGVSFLIVYEIVHGICHYYQGDNRFLNYFCKHHGRHHDSRFMESKNFSVVFPIVDSIFSTLIETPSIIGEKK